MKIIRIVTVTIALVSAGIAVAGCVYRDHGYYHGYHYEHRYDYR